MAKQDNKHINPTHRVAYRIKEVSAMTGIPASTIRSRIHAGEINVITSLGCWLVSHSELERILGITLRPQDPSNFDSLE